MEQLNLGKALLFVLCGVQGSGKTTWARKLSADIEAVLYCIDDFYTVHKPKQHDEITTLLHASICKDLRNGKDVVCDGTYVTKNVRLQLLNSIVDIPCKKILVVMDTPLEECLRRNANRTGRARVRNDIVGAFAKMYQPPTRAEGWDEIIVI